MVKSVRRVLVLGVLATAAFCATPSYADVVQADGFKYSDEVTVIGLKGGQLQVRVKSADKLFDLGKVESIELTGQDKFNEAETSRKDAKKAAALYHTAVNNANGKLRLVVEARAIGPNDADGRFSEAVNYFLDVYAAGPTDAVWKLRPVNIPAAGSTLLKESADRIQAKLASFSSEDAKKNLKTFEMELLTRANDPRAAALAKELNGTNEPAAAPVKAAPAAEAAAQAPSAAPVGETLEGISKAVNAKNYDGAITQAEAMLKSSTGDTAIQLWQLEAQAYIGQKNLEAAAATLMRIPAHYAGANPAAAAGALLEAARLQEQMQHPDEAKRLYKEITDNYPNSPAAVNAKGKS